MKAKSAEKKPNIFVRMGRKLKEVFSELKKVTWPTFGKVVKATGVVLVVVVIFLVIFEMCIRDSPCPAPRSFGGGYRNIAAL